MMPITFRLVAGSLPLLLAAALDAQQAGIRGAVRDSAGAAVSGALVELDPVSAPTPHRATRTAPDGGYEFARLSAGSYSIRVIRLGFRPESSPLTVVAGEVVTRNFLLGRAAVPLAQVVVSPGRFGVLDQRLGAPQTLSREDIDTRPQFGEDIYRIVNRLPGVSASDYSAKFRVRNGGNDEVLVRLDGLELYEPFHLKDFDGSLSLLDVAAIGGVDLLTGGFSAEYGDKLTGVFDIVSSDRAPARARTSLGMSITNLRALSEGAFGSGRGSWLASVRRGYLDLVLKLIGEEDAPDPTYYDLFGKVTWQLSPNHTIGARILEARDNTYFVESDDVLNSSYGNRYGWTTLDSRFAGGRVGARTMVSAGLLTWSRDGIDSIFSNATTPPRKVQGLSVADRRRMRVIGVKQDWTAEVSERLLVKAGADVKHFNTGYDYLAWQLRDSVDGLGRFSTYADTTRVNAAPEGPEVGAYASVRVRPRPALALEFGARFDRESWTDEQAVTPRVAAAWEIPGDLTLRAAWGRYRQAQGIHELNALDGDPVFHPAEVAEHRVIGAEWNGRRGVTARVEGYERRIAAPRPRWVNLDMDIDVFGEHSWDRALLIPDRALARGLELFVQRDPGGRWSQTLSYALAKATEKVGGGERPRMYDQRHTVQFEGAFKPNPKWRFATAWQYHSGWPISIARFVEDTIRNASGAVTGRRVRRWNSQINDARLAPYARLDLRATRRIRVRGGEMQLYFDLFNALNRGNVRGYDYSVSYQGSTLVTRRDASTYLPRLPTIGMTLEF